MIVSIPDPESSGFFIDYGQGYILRPKQTVDTEEPLASTSPKHKPEI